MVQPLLGDGRPMTTPFLRLTFRCLNCGAQQSFDKPFGSMRRYLAAGARMEPQAEEPLT